MLTCAGSQSAWIKEPPAKVQVEHGLNAVLEWDYDLNGRAISFAKWGKVEKDQSWDKSYITRGEGDSVATVLPMHKSKVQWIANATMVVMNASLSDAGYYGCSIDLSDGTHIKSSTELEVFREYIVNN